MGFNLFGYSEAAPGINGNIAVALNEQQYALLDARDAVKIVALTPYILGVWAAAEATGGRINLQQPGKTDKGIFKVMDTAQVDPIIGFTNFMQNPLRLALDKLTCNSVNATDEDTTVGLMLGSGPFPKTPFTIDEVITGFSDTTLAVANTWELTDITWNQTPEAGLYEIVTMKVGVFLAANPWTTLARLIIPGHPEFRPGVAADIIGAAHTVWNTGQLAPYNIWGKIGVQFRAPEQMPNLECMSTSLISDENIELGLMKVGA